jgi:tetratricopeptide (TPR) repeat protein
MPTAEAAPGADGLEVSRPVDEEYRKALDLVYDGAFSAAEARLDALAGANPEDPVGPYLQALACEWRLEQAPQSHALDPVVLALADRALALAEDRLRGDGGDGRALLARGAAHAIKSRLALFRVEKSDAAREAVRMREALLRAREAGVEVMDVDFGLGLYDYYAETLPRLYRLLRFLAGIPGGNRVRGLDAICRVARGGSLFHTTEARVQMFEILSYYEERPDGALSWIREVWRQYPGWPLWGLKLAEILRDPLGLYGESATVARGILEMAEEGRHPNYQPVVAAMARVALGEALLGDLRFEAARVAALPAEAGVPDADWVAPRAALVVARSLELEGARDAAISHYRRAAAGGDHAVAGRARSALASPIPLRVRAAAHRLAEARRLREGGRTEEARARCLEALRAQPASPEARVCVAEGSLERGDVDAARALVVGIADIEGDDEWLRPRARLVLARALEREGDRGRALELYKEVWQAPFGRPALRMAAAAAIGRLAPTLALPSAPRWER